MTVPILTICIPTYNRANCLEQQLIRLQELDEVSRQSIEIIVSDNCSKDDTPKIAQKFSETLNFTYLRNQENLGPDGNFLQCFQKSSGRYIWLLGDDDYLCTKHIPELLAILEENKYGLIHISNHNKKKVLQTFASHEDYIGKLGTWLTFMSANIFCREIIAANDYAPSIGTYLIQVPMYMDAIFKREENAICNYHLFDAATACATSGGYNIMRVFIKNFSEILDGYRGKELSPHTLFVVRNKISDFIFPYIFNFLILKKDSNFDTKGAHALLKEYLGYPRIAWSAVKFFLSPKIMLMTLQRLGGYIKKYGMKALLRSSLLFYPPSLANKLSKFKDAFSSYRFSHATSTPDIQSYIHGNTSVKGGKFITLGEHFSSLSNLRIECIENGEEKPKLTIGNQVSFGYRVHIAVSNLITIGNNVLLGSNILITDHNHGKTDETSLATPPTQRPIYSKGPVIIEDDVWIGDNAIILPNVTIGKGSIIGAGAIVTHNVPPYSRVVGTAAQPIQQTTLFS